MQYWTEYEGHIPNILGQKKLYDNTIYTFDIETSSYIILDNEIFKASDYLKLTKEEQERAKFQSVMYIWQFSINETVYYGRTWEELYQFMTRIENNIPEKKYLYIHNASYEFQFLRNKFKMKNVFSRKTRKVIKFEFEDFNFEARCTYYMSNSSLEKLAENFKLPVKKLVGSLDYTKIRTPATKIYHTELAYCEHDCLCVYEYIKKELETYITLKNIPLTSTGHVRKEMKEKVVEKNWSYINKVRKAVNVDPHVYNLLITAFGGGYVHACYLYANEVLKNVTSFDYASSYPYCLCCFKYPATEFKKCNIKRLEQLLPKFAYLIRVRFKNIKSKYYNHIISVSKCTKIKNVKIDNGRIISADEIEMVVTDIDIHTIINMYSFDSYEFIEAYYSFYDYLPKDFIEFILKKYVSKTKLKNVAGQEVLYMMEKNKFNSLYGMAVTNNIKQEVIFDNVTGWHEEDMTNEKIIELLEKDKEKVFLSFAYGVWCTSRARSNLISCMQKLDKWCVYGDTDSLKLLEGYDQSVIDNYNKEVLSKIDEVCNHFGIEKEKFSPLDIKGISHTMGLFENDGNYEEFKTLGSKKYAYVTKIPIEKAKKSDSYKILRSKDGIAWCLGITLSGVPKSGAKALSSLSDFKNGFIFDYKFTNKLMVAYNDSQEPVWITDYQNKKYFSRETFGECLLPTTYELRTN